MTTLSWLLILASASEGLRIVCGLLAGASFAIASFYIIYMCGGFTYKDLPKGTSKKWPVICYVATLLLALAAAMMPDKKTVYMVAGVETINKFSQTEVAKELGDSGMSIVKDVTTMIHTYTMDAVKENKKKKRRDDDDEE